jgi:amino-acid N-acetyltransferase
VKYEFARNSDVSQIREILAQFELAHEDITPAHLEHFMVLRDGAQIAGVVGLELLGGCALLRSLCVRARDRERGIASELTKRVEEYALSSKVGALYLLTTTAEGFFAKRGYQRIERNSAPVAIQETAEFQSLCPASAVCMVKHLNTV